MAWYYWYALIALLSLIGFALLIPYENKKYPVRECIGCGEANNLIGIDETDGHPRCGFCRSAS